MKTSLPEGKIRVESLAASERFRRTPWLVAVSSGRSVEFRVERREAEKFSERTMRYAAKASHKMNPYAAPRTHGELNVNSGFNAAEWWSHSWSLNDTPVSVLHREPFRLKWFATQLVTFAFVIHRRPEDIASIDADYKAIRKFASRHKRTWLPFTFHCGYALLPIYIGESFDDSLIHQVESRFTKRWCVFHVPSLLDSGTGKVHTLHHKSFWGCVYRDYIHTTVAQVAHAAHAGKLAA